MKRFLKILMFTMLFMGFTFFLVSCREDENEIKVSILVIKNASIVDNEIAMFSGNETILEAQVMPVGTPVNWSSSNEDIATISSTGLLKALSAGESIITLKAGNKTTTVKVKVIGVVDVNSITFSEENYEIFAKRDIDVKLSLASELIFAPENVTYKTVTWDIIGLEDADIESVSINASGEVTVFDTAVLDSQYLITATSIINSSIKATTLVTVKYTAAEDFTVRWSHQPAATGNNFEFPLSYSMYEGLNFVAEPYPIGSMDKIEFSSSDTNVIKVINDDKGNWCEFKIVGVGQAVISVVSTNNETLNKTLNIEVVPTTEDNDYVLIYNYAGYNLNLTFNDIKDLEVDAREYWNFDPEGETYVKDRADSNKNWQNMHVSGKTPIEMLNSGNGQSIFDGGYAWCFDSWDWPQDNEQTNLYMYNKIVVPTDKNVLKARVRTQRTGGTTGKGKFRIRLVDLDTYESYFLQKDALLRINGFSIPEDRSELADAGIQDSTSNWISIDYVLDFTVGEDWFYFSIPNELKGKTMLIIFEVDDIHTPEIGTDGCDRIQLICLYFADNSNPDPNDLRSIG